MWALGRMGASLSGSMDPFSVIAAPASRRPSLPRRGAHGQPRPIRSVHNGSTSGARGHPRLAPTSGTSSVVAPIAAQAASPLTTPAVALPMALAVDTLEDTEGERKWKKKNKHMEWVEPLLDPDEIRNQV